MPLVIGDTAHIIARFVVKNIDVTAEIYEPTVNIYNQDRKLLQSATAPEVALNSDDEYEYAYVVPDGKGDLIIEFSGMYAGKPRISRRGYARVWKE